MNAARAINLKGLIFKMIAMVIVMVGISNYMLYIMTGRSPFDGFKLPSVSDAIPNSIDDIKPSLGGKQTVYKWVDENGVTQYSSEPPPNQATTSLELDPETNIIQSVEVPSDEGDDSTLSNKNNETPQLALPEGPVYSPDNIKKLIDDAKNVQKTLDERYQKQEEMLKEL